MEELNIMEEKKKKRGIKINRLKRKTQSLVGESKREDKTGREK